MLVSQEGLCSMGLVSQLMKLSTFVAYEVSDF